MKYTYDFDSSVGNKSELIIENFNSMKKARVLLIEDDRTVRRMVHKAIGEHCELAEAWSAGNGVSKVINFDPDIVFLDLELPDDNGHEILKWIMRNDPGAHVVIVSGHSDNHNVQKAVANGARGFVPKPFDADLLVDYICNCPKLH